MEAPSPLLVALQNEKAAIAALHEAMVPRFHELQHLHQMDSDECKMMFKRFAKMNKRDLLLRQWIIYHENPRILNATEDCGQAGLQDRDKYHKMVYEFELTRKIMGAKRAASGYTA